MCMTRSLFHTSSHTPVGGPFLLEGSFVAGAHDCLSDDMMFWAFIVPLSIGGP